MSLVRKGPALILALLISLLPVPPIQAAVAGAGTAFSDLSPTHPDANYIAFLADRKIINGYPDGRFGPEDPLTRAAAVKIATGVMAITPRAAAGKAPFADVSNSHWSAPYLEPAVLEGLVTGYDDGTFGPDQVLTRAQLAALAVRTTRQSQSEIPAAALVDVSPEDWFYGVAALAVKAGLMDAPDGRFRPGDTATRAEAAHAFAAAYPYNPKHLLESLTAMLEPQGAAVEVGSGAGAFKPAAGPTSVAEGTRIRTGADASATLRFPDGSTALVDSNSEATLLSNRGTESPGGVVMDGLRVDLAYGRLFLALAPVGAVVSTPAPVASAPGSVMTAGTRLQLSAARGAFSPADPAGLAITAALVGTDGRPSPAGEDTPIWLYATAGLLSDDNPTIPAGQSAITLHLYPLAEQTILTEMVQISGTTGFSNDRLTLRASTRDWWEAPQAQRVRATVGMPWGEAQVRGTVLSATTTAAENSVSVLSGDADLVSYGPGGVRRSLTDEQRASLFGPGQEPGAAAALTRSDRQAWTNRQGWVSGFYETAHAGPGAAKAEAEALAKALARLADPGYIARGGDDPPPADTEATSGSDDGGVSVVGGGGGTPTGGGGSTDSGTATPPVPLANPEVVVQAPASARVGEHFTATIRLQDVTQVKAAVLRLTYDPVRLKAVKITPGTILAGLTARKSIDQSAGWADYWTATTGPGFTGSGIFCQVEYEVLASGSTTLRLTTTDPAGALATDPAGTLWATSHYLPASLGSAVVSLND